MTGKTKLDLAIEIAAFYHKNQNRKSSNIPYVTHPVSVGFFLMENGFCKDLVIAAILHDTIEDTTLKLEKIERLFGENIAKLVQDCSEPEHNLRKWEERKQHTVDFIRKANLDSVSIIFADKLHNLRTINSSIKEIGDKSWDIFARGKDKQKWYYENLYKSFEYKFSNERSEKHMKLLSLFKEEIDTAFN